MRDFQLPYLDHKERLVAEASHLDEGNRKTSSERGLGLKHYAGKRSHHAWECQSDVGPVGRQPQRLIPLPWPRW